MAVTEQEILDSIPPMEEKRQASLDRAAEKRAKGREDQAVAWDASAARYAKLVELKQRLAARAARLAEIRARIAAPPKVNEGVPGTPRFDPGVNAGVGGSAPAPEPAPAPKPPPPPPPPPEPGVPAIKTASIDTVIFNDELVNQNIIADLLFEDVGGQEILTISRYDTVNGQDVSYQPIKNLNLIQQEYNPNNLVRLQATSDRIFANFPIKLGDKIPVEGNGPDGENIYLDSTGSIVIEFINLLGDEQVEIQIASSGTIYEAEI
jgi:hypothetical protein